MPWAIKWRSENRLDGKKEFLMGAVGESIPPYSGYTIYVFKTRAKARKFIKSFYGYIQRRSDLRAEPHGWKMPVAVKVEVRVKEVVSELLQ